MIQYGIIKRQSFLTIMMIDFKSESFPDGAFINERNDLNKSIRFPLLLYLYRNIPEFLQIFIPEQIFCSCNDLSLCRFYIDLESGKDL